jgi:hypothetical protein
MKQKFYSVTAAIAWLTFTFFILTCFFSCKETETLYGTTYSASYDFANTKEAGPSLIKYDPKTGINVVSYAKIWFPILSASHDDADYEYDEYSSFYSAMSGGRKDNNTGIGTGIEFIQKGNKFKEGGFKTRLNYLEIPVNFLYRSPMKSGYMYGGLGPYFAYGIGGKTGEVSSFGIDNGGYKRFDAGLDIMAGYQFDMGACISAGYDYGLLNTAYSGQDFSSHNRCFSINVGFQLAKLFDHNKK